MDQERNTIKCHYCSKVLDKSQFYPSHLRRHRCKACECAYQRGRHQDRSKRYESLKWKRYVRKRHSRYVREHKDIVNVRQKTMYYVKLGVIKRDPCRICEETKVEGHHPDYKDAFNVIWLCRKHHRALHRKYDKLEI